MPPVAVRHWYIALLVLLVATAWVFLFWVAPQPSMPGWLVDYTRFTYRLGQRLWSSVGYLWLWAGLSLVLGVMAPLGIAALLGRRPTQLGLAWPNVLGRRIIAVGYVLALPFLVIVGGQPAFQQYYRPYLQGDAWVILVQFELVLFAEQFFFQGFLLAFLLPGSAFPPEEPPPPQGGGRWLRLLRWVGLARATSGKRGLEQVLAWLGLDRPAALAILLQSIPFLLVHLGKAPVEFIASFPGGFLFGYIAYRARSFLPVLLLHTLTGGTLLLVVWRNLR
ncbi:MAG: CPBP family intramembrane metalloprotease [Deinococcus sp.]|nr:CPBP family intramembrane metalloprotease [Deinococcus sp.]